MVNGDIMKEEVNVLPGDEERVHVPERLVESNEETCEYIKNENNVTIQETEPIEISPSQNIVVENQSIFTATVAPHTSSHVEDIAISGNEDIMDDVLTQKQYCIEKTIDKIIGQNEAVIAQTTSEAITHSPCNPEQPEVDADSVQSSQSLDLLTPTEESDECPADPIETVSYTTNSLEAIDCVHPGAEVKHDNDSCPMPTAILPNGDTEVDNSREEAKSNDNYFSQPDIFDCAANAGRVMDDSQHPLDNETKIELQKNDTTITACTSNLQAPERNTPINMYFT